MAPLSWTDLDDDGPISAFRPLERPVTGYDLTEMERHAMVTRAREIAQARLRALEATPAYWASIMASGRTLDTDLTEDR